MANIGKHFWNLIPILIQGIPEKTIGEGREGFFWDTMYIDGGEGRGDGRFRTLSVNILY